ncbi:D-threitol dehydrogenase [Paenibacillus marchantiophytorum]|uniref:D-threitol dehydrogenase n=1 Tax=Paenibacillus marchantiophytorum TaxID=1619310 RepID=A0ABQ1FGD5_9BACL|nr:SDR family NAD(P)-dependent oxidoreductase [Paenibacillus marchantiophytorum]GGA12104.1 D-threitol dehydrogenase [Paenibacillus marchantiophytorum]
MKDTAGFNFAGKTALVTGAAKGIGADIAAQFIRYGANVIIADVDEQGEAVAARWRQDGYAARFFRCDVSQGNDVAQLAAYAEQEFGGLDMLVNNAGIFPRATLSETDEALWDRVIGINLKGVYLMCQAAVPGMISRGGGSIVNIGSLHAATGASDMLAYAISKGGVVTLTRNLASTLAKHRVRVNCIHPGWVASDGEMARIAASGENGDTLEKAIKRMPMGRMQTGNDIASAVVFMMSDFADQITGQQLTVDGGISIR